MRHLALLALVAGCSVTKVDPSVTPESLWITPAAPVLPTLPDGVKVRAVTLNLHGGQDARPPHIIETLNPLNVDFLGLEECPAAYADEIGPALGLMHRVGTEGNVLLSRTALTATRSVSMDAGRGFVSAQTVVDGASLSVYVAHIGWNVEGDLQCQEFSDRHIKPDPSERLLVMGDFNDEHLSSQADILETELEDAYTALGWYPGQRISWPATGFDGSEGSQLIDLFYYRKRFAPIVVAADVINAAPVLSDHKPARVDLIYPRGEAPFTVDPFPGRREPWAAVVQDPAKNLLVNPGAELGDAGWVADRGLIAQGVRQTQAPHAGAAHFAGADVDVELPFVSGWSQRVDLDSSREIDATTAVLNVAGWMAVGFRTVTDGTIVSNIPQPYDEGEVIVDIENSRGQVIRRWSTGRRDTLRYHPFAARIELPRTARTVTMTLLSHRKEASGSSHDAVFDDLYMALEIVAPHGAKPDVLRIDGTAAMGGWSAMKDGQQLGVMVYPAQSRSGPTFLAAGPLVAPTNPEMVEGSTDQILLDGRGVHFGGWIRTVNALGSATLGLAIYEVDATTPWHVFELPAVSAAEWTYVEGRVRFPAGALTIALTARGEVGTDQVLLDDLFARPIDLP